MGSIVFKARVSKSGKRYVIYIPKALHEMMKSIVGKKVIITIEDDVDEHVQC
ncbi:hypothetical protein [Candidatus Culexarchaeum yellowstonense]|uniref:hypothetical protein n=1 Tax=Candidatus Culexarchaeum yellowstonense TaxID=2928963 RepID=UPI0026EB0560|nr:hypothetical protein [Candidatus Culexarchaeum yellowstonense]